MSGGCGIPSAGTTTSTFQTPLSNVVTCNNSETLLVTDSVSCDGRFVLYTCAAATLGNNNSSSSSNINNSSAKHTTAMSSTTAVGVSSELNRVLWVSCTSTTNESIQNALKKIGCDKTAVIGHHQQQRPHSVLVDSKLQKADGHERLLILSVCSIVESSVNEAGGFDDVNFIEVLYRRIKAFVSRQDDSATSNGSSEITIVIDDISALTALVGECLTYGLIFSLQSLQKSNEMCNAFGIVVRCSNEHDIEATGLGITGNSGGSITNDQSTTATTTVVPWERALVELADSIVDVTRLASGYSRVVHGRLTISTRLPGTTTSNIYNYCVTDSQVIVMRLAPYAS